MNWRRIKRSGAILVLLIVVAAVLLPYWLAVVARPLLLHYGMEWKQHESGWKRLNLNHVTFIGNSVEVSAATVSLNLAAIRFAGFRHSEKNKEPFITIDDWSVRVIAPVSQKEPISYSDILDALEQTGWGWNALARYVPSAFLKRGTVRFSSADPACVLIPEIHWKNGEVQSAFQLCVPDRAPLFSGDLYARMHWPDRGRLSLTLRQIDQIPPHLLPAVFAVVSPENGSLKIVGEWDRGPLSFTLRQMQVFRLPKGNELNAELSLKGGNAGIELQSLDARLQGETVMHAEGHFPLVITPGGDEKSLCLHRDMPFLLHAVTAPDPVFQTFSEGFPTYFVNPALIADITGTLADLQGKIQLKANSVNIPIPPALRNRALPAVSDLQAELRFSTEYAELKRLTVRVAGQEIVVTAKLPLGEEAWSDMLRRRQLPLWSLLRGTLQITNAEMAAFSPYVPGLAPNGVGTASLRFEPDGRLYGTVECQDVAIRSFTPIGTITSIRGEGRFDGRTLTVRELTGTVGDRTVSVAGDARLHDDFSVDYTLQIKGEKVPFVRRSGLLLRGDVDVTATGSTGEREEGIIAGEIRLHNGYYLSELHLPSAGNVTLPAQRPPFFSVDAAPFADWKLNLKISGDRFLQVRSPMFNGFISADIHLGGTLREPIAPGQLIIDSGIIRFPFATLKIEKGTVRLTQENPYLAQLQVTGTGQAFGYEIRLDLRGPADDPTLTFSATPPLSSEAVLMLVTAGEIPTREIAFTGQQRAARLALFLGQNLLYELTEDENAGDRLVIESGRNISRQGKETLMIKYQLSDRLSVTGEYDEYDAINAGIRLRLFTR